MCFIRTLSTGTFSERVLVASSLCYSCEGTKAATVVFTLVKCQLNATPFPTYCPEAVEVFEVSLCLFSRQKTASPGMKLSKM